MRTGRQLVRVLVPPVLAVALLAWWCIAEAANSDGLIARVSDLTMLLLAPSTWTALLLFVGLAITWALPQVAVVALYVAFSVQLLGVDDFFGQAGWPASAAIVLAAVVFAVRVDDTRRRRPALLALIPLGVLIGIMLDLRGIALLREGVLQDPMGAVVLPLVGRSAAAIAVILAGWAIGSTVGARRRLLTAQSETHAVRSDLAESRIELRVAEERDRIAQDVHDITAHSLSVIVAQAGGGAAQAGDDISRTALSTIATSARSALAEVRTLLENLDDPRGDTGFTAADIKRLVEGVRATGRTVGLEQRGDATVLPAASGLAAYRIAQEALTNAVRHGGDGPIAVALDWQPSGLSIVISSPLGPDAAGSAVSGRGLIGMQQRARLVGGWASTGPDNDAGRYVLTAFLPLARSLAAS